MFLSAAFHRGGDLLFYVATKEKVRLNDDTADRAAHRDGIPAWISAGGVCDRLGQGRSGRGHKPQFDPRMRQAVGLILAGSHSEVMELPMGRRVAGTPANHQQDRLFFGNIRKRR
jgi:hypothetical protein